jgi:hypothetical protein
LLPEPERARLHLPLSLRFASLLLLLAAGAAFGQDRPKAEVITEWGAYYTSVGLYIPISAEQFPDGGRLNEIDVYRQLFERSWRPNVVAFEASVYPMPIAGVWLRQEYLDFYDRAPSLIQAATAGFQEPWAVSAFFGSQMKFSRPDETERGTNRGYMGYLVSAGTKHIKSNVLIADDWLELEWKLKGERIFKEDRLDWSFRVGGRYNSNRDIADTLHIGLRRSNLDFRSPFLSWLDNSRIDLLTELAVDGLTLVRQEVIFGKKYPLESRKYALELDFGLIYERASKYSGDLAPLAKTAVTVVFRPNIVF